MCNSRDLVKISSALSKDQYIVQNWTNLFELLLPTDHGLRMQLEKNFYEMKMSIDSVFNHILTHWTARHGFQSIPELVEILEKNKYKFAADRIREIVLNGDTSSKIVDSLTPTSVFLSDKRITLGNITKLSRSLANDQILAQNWEKFATALLPQGSGGVIPQQGFLHLDTIRSALTQWTGRSRAQDVTVSKLVEILKDNEFVSAAEIVMELEPSL